jgi:Fe-S cluster assembly protein SufD
LASASPAVELPTFKGRPGWEFTDITGLDLAAYEPVSGDEAATATPLFDLPEAAQLPDGVIVATIDEAMREHAELIEKHLGSLVSADDPFVTLNDAGYRNGSFVYVPSGVAVEQPISPGRCSTSAR